VLPTSVTIPIAYGDVFRHITAGGGGYGDPRDRDPELVLVDVLDGKLSAEDARREYGVALDQEKGCVDVAGTQSLRQRDGSPGLVV
jgi:N-methylhydantoinase B